MLYQCANGNLINEGNKGKVKDKNYKLLIASHGGNTIIVLDGKVYCDQINEIKFEHVGGEIPTLALDTDYINIEPVGIVDEKVRSYIEELLTVEETEKKCSEQLIFKRTI